MVKTHDFSIAKYGETQELEVVQQNTNSFRSATIGKEKNSTCGVEGGDGHSLVIP